MCTASSVAGTQRLSSLCAFRSLWKTMNCERSSVCALRKGSWWRKRFYKAFLPLIRCEHGGELPYLGFSFCIYLSYLSSVIPIFQADWCEEIQVCISLRHCSLFTKNLRKMGGYSFAQYADAFSSERITGTPSHSASCTSPLFAFCQSWAPSASPTAAETGPALYNVTKRKRLLYSSASTRADSPHSFQYHFKHSIHSHLYLTRMLYVIFII